jgi:putative hydroxymethylpyrimidine transport system substrate-binding protein
MKKLLFLLLTLLPALSLAATPAPQKLSVMLDWFPNPDHAPLVIAEQQGYFKEQGLEVELISPADPTDAPKMVAAKKADIGITYEPEFMQQVDHGLPLISVGILIDKPLNCLIALNDSNKIKTINDLKGKRIGIVNSGVSEIMMKVLLQKQGLKENDVELINVRYNLTQALLSRQVDAVTGVMRNVEVPSLELNNHKVNAFFPEENGIPTYSELIFITHASNAKDPRIAHFLVAISKAVAYLDKHPKKGWQAFIKAYPETNNEVNREAWFATLPYFAEEPGNINKAEWERFARFMSDNKLITKPKTMNKYIIA